MKETFSEYQPYEKEKIIGLWSKAHFVFDTNVILNLYRYSSNTSEMFINIISDLTDRIWLPYQVGLEFNKNRLGVISDQKKKYLAFNKDIENLIKEVENKNKNPFFSQPLTEKIISIRIEIYEEVQRITEKYDKFFTTDPLLEKINSIFENKVGEEYSEEKMLEINKDGEKRYKNKIPPGYCDDNKPQNEKFGDLILWNQIIDRAVSTKNDVIFILDDRKEDWWLESQGKTISPRPELLKEFKTKTSRHIHFYKPDQFLEHSNTYLKKTVQRQTIEEVKNYIDDEPPNNFFLKIEFVLQGTLIDFNKLYSEMKSAGYNVSSETDETTKLHHLNVILPNIPDLERRLHSRYISDLDSYSLTLVGIKKL